MEDLIIEEEIVRETRIDFGQKLSKWLIKQGFKRELYDFSYPKKYIYRHKELPIKIEPRKEDSCWFGNYEIDFCEIIYAKAEGIAQLSQVKSCGKTLDTLVLLEDTQDKMQKAFELAKKVIDKIKKGDYK